MSEAKTAEKNPYSGVTNHTEFTRWELAHGPQCDIFIPPKTRPQDADVVMIAGINGIEYWAKKGESARVPEEVARIAIRAGIAYSGNPPAGTHCEMRPVGQQPPKLAIHPNPAMQSGALVPPGMKD